MAAPSTRNIIPLLPTGFAAQLLQKIPQQLLMFLSRR